MNANFCDVDLDLVFEVEEEIVRVLITKGREAEADEITRQLENLKEIIGNGDTVYP